MVKFKIVSWETVTLRAKSQIAAQNFATRVFKDWPNCSAFTIESKMKVSSTFSAFPWAGPDPILPFAPRKSWSCILFNSPFYWFLKGFRQQ